MCTGTQYCHSVLSGCGPCRRIVVLPLFLHCQLPRLLPWLAPHTQLQRSQLHNLRCLQLTAVPTAGASTRRASGALSLPITASCTRSFVFCLFGTSGWSFDPTLWTPVWLRALSSKNLHFLWTVSDLPCQDDRCADKSFCHQWRQRYECSAPCSVHNEVLRFFPVVQRCWKGTEQNFITDGRYCTANTTISTCARTSNSGRDFTCNNTH